MATFSIPCCHYAIRAGEKGLSKQKRRFSSTNFSHDAVLRRMFEMFTISATLQIRQHMGEVFHLLRKSR